MATMTAIQTVTVGGGGAASIEFTSIPQTYTDLVLVLSLRADITTTVYELNFNGDTSIANYEYLRLTGDGASATSVTANNFGTLFLIGNTPTGHTANTFSSSQVYILNYAGSTFKSVSQEGVIENNSQSGYDSLAAGLYKSTSAITSLIVKRTGANLVQYTTATLYGVWKGPETLPSTPTIGTATAVDVTTATVAFTPTSATGVDASYTALSTPGSITATGTSSPVTVSGLTSSTAYTFQVRANNPGGSSAYSSASNSITTPSTSYESIATVTVGSGGAANIDFTSIPATYTHLQIRGIGRSLEANTGVDVQYLRFNSDTGSNYAWHQLVGNGSSASATGASSTSFARGGFIALDSEPANVFGGVVIDIIDYTNTNKYKTVRILSGTEYNNSNGGVSFNSGLWQNTDAITTITLQPSGANFAEYSQFALYGIKDS